MAAGLALCLMDRSCWALGGYNRHKLDAFVARVQDFIAQRQLLPPASRVLAAVSGGADSMALLDCLTRLGYSVTVAHLDHGIRPGSWGEAELVLRRAAERGIPAIAERWEVPQAAAAGENLEAAARRLRYTFLARLAAETGSGAIATGHTADDQVETFLLHLLRGSGTQGLRGMLPEQALSGVVAVPAAGGVRLVRPLLCVWRHETIDFCRRLGTPVIEDPSNLNRDLLRNRVRHELVPQLEGYNPQVRKAIWRAAQATAEAHAALVEDAGLGWARAAIETEDGVLLRLRPLRQSPEAVQKLMLRRAFTACGGEIDQSGAIERLQRLCQPGSPAHAEMGGGVDVWRTGARLFIVRAADDAWAGFPQCVHRSPSALLPERRIRLRHGWSLRCERIAARGGSPAKLRAEPGALSAWLPVESREPRLSVRPWQAGDRMRLFGTGGTVKVADLLARAQVPPPARRGWPVVLLGGEVAWIPGVQRGELCRVPSSAHSLLHLELTEPRGKPVWLDRLGAPAD